MFPTFQHKAVVAHFFGQRAAHKRSTVHNSTNDDVACTSSAANQQSDHAANQHSDAANQHSNHADLATTLIGDDIEGWSQV